MVWHEEALSAVPAQPNDNNNNNNCVYMIEIRFKIKVTEWNVLLPGAVAAAASGKLVLVPV